jgi:hypothetical protein
VLGLTPVILATWEAEIRIVVRGQPGQKVHKTPSPKLSEQNGLEVWLKQYNTCFLSMKPRVQTPVPQKNKNLKIKEKGKGKKRAGKRG